MAGSLIPKFLGLDFLKGETKYDPYVVDSDGMAVKMKALNRIRAGDFRMGISTLNEIRKTHKYETDCFRDSIPVPNYHIDSDEFFFYFYSIAEEFKSIGM